MENFGVEIQIRSRRLKMINDEYLGCVDKLLSLAKKIEDEKRPAYTNNSTDVLHNFKSNAVKIGINSRQAWANMWLKHVDAISSWAANPSTPQAEELEGRFADLINYTKLGYAIYCEEHTVKHSDRR